MKLTRDSQETHINLTGQERLDGIFHIYSDNPVWLKRFEKLGMVGKVINEFGGTEFTLDMNEYTFSVRKKRKVSDKQREALREASLNTRFQKVDPR